MHLNPSLERRCVWVSAISPFTRRAPDRHVSRFYLRTKPGNKEPVRIAVPPPLFLCCPLYLSRRPRQAEGEEWRDLKVRLTPSLHRPPADVLLLNVTAVARVSFAGKNDGLFFFLAESVKAYLQQTSLRWVMSL